jgi:hypothetical protein
MPQWIASGRCGPARNTSRRGTAPTASPSPSRRWTCASAAPVWCPCRCKPRTAPCRCGSPASTARSSRTSDSSTPSPCPTQTATCYRPPTWACPKGHPTTTEVRVELEDVGGRTKMVMTPCRHSRRLPGFRRMGDGARQARRPRRSTQRPIAPVILGSERGPNMEPAHGK